jgi:osmotically-inducible protein OsmY
MSTFRNLTVLVLAAALSGGALAKTDSEDARIAAEVRQQIDAHPSLRFYNIQVRSVDHVVYLEGIVDSRMDCGQATDAARSVPGVARVYSELALAGNGN